jgi:hypothetical protein
MACFNPHPLRRAGATLVGTTKHHIGIVSILTRSEERVQPADHSPLATLVSVSILTRSEERVQP